MRCGEACAERRCAARPVRARVWHHGALPMRRSAARLGSEALRFRRARRVIAALVASASASTAAHADAPPKARLHFERDDSADACPDEDTFRRDVAARLGYEPFDVAAPRTLHLRVLRAGDRFSAILRLEGEDMGATGERSLTATDCGELLASAASSAAMAIDPFATGARASSPAAPPDAPRPPPSQAPTRETPEAPPPARAHGSPWHGVGSLGAAAAFGVVPDATVGGLLAFELRHPRASLGVEGRAHLPASAPALRGSVDASTVVGSLVPCGWLGRLFLCAVASLGAIRGEGKGVSSPQRASGPYASVALRAGGEIALGERIALRPFAEIATPLRRTTLTIDGDPAWVTPTVAASTGLAIAATFW